MTNPFSIRALRAAIPVGTLVLHDVFGLGETSGSVSNNSSNPDRTFVAVTFEDDDPKINDCRIGSRTCEDTGSTETFGFRNILLSHLVYDEAALEAWESDEDDGAEEACARFPEDDADFAERFGQEPENSGEPCGEADLLADFAAELAEESAG